MTKSSEMVNVPPVIDDAEETVADRRGFIKGVGVAVLTVQLLPLMAHASGSAPSEGNEAADDLIIHSSTGFVPHVHDLLIPYAVLEAPPRQGVELRTTQALFHRHTVRLTKDQLVVVNQGGTVTEKGGSHLFVISLARPDDIQSGSVDQGRRSD
jgi:hypothetical protein